MLKAINLSELINDYFGVIFMLTFATLYVSDRPALKKCVVYRVPNPVLCFQKMVGSPGVKCFNLSSLCCRAVAVGSVIGGFVTIGLVEASSSSSQTKTAACIVGGLLVLSSYYCCKLGLGYAEAKDAMLNQGRIRSDDIC